VPFGLSIGRSSKLEIDIVGDREFARELFGLYTRAMNMQPVMEEVIDFLRENVRQAYFSKGARGGNIWKPLNEAYVRWKLKKGLDPRIMLATHDLYNSLAHTTSDSIAETDEDSLKFGSKAMTKPKRGKAKSKLALHQSRKPRKKLPRRAPVDLTMLDKQEIVGMFRDHIVGLRRAAL